MTPAIRGYLQARGKLGRVAFFVKSGDTDVAFVLPSLETAAAMKTAASLGFNQQEPKDAGVYRLTLTAFLTALGLPLTAGASRGGDGAKAA